MSKKVIRRPAVKAKTGLSDSALYRKEKAGDFPSRVQLGPNAIGWFEDEVDEWLENLSRGFADAPEKAIEARNLPPAA